MTSKVRFRKYKLSWVALNKRFPGYKLSRTPKKIAKSRKFIPTKVYTNKVPVWMETVCPQYTDQLPHTRMRLYEILCTDCKQYRGQSGRSVYEWMKEHFFKEWERMGPEDSYLHSLNTTMEMCLVWTWVSWTNTGPLQHSENRLQPFKTGVGNEKKTIYFIRYST